MRRALKRRYGHATRADLRAAKAAYEAAVSDARQADASTGYAGNSREAADRAWARARAAHAEAARLLAVYKAMRGVK